MEQASEARPSVQDPLLGQVLDERYRILKRIGRGGMGVVYLAEHVLLRRKFAVKVLPFDGYESRHGAERFLREAQAAAAVGEQHVVDVTDMGQLPSGQRYIVLEYLDGEDLSARVRRSGPFSADETVALLAQLCEALSAVHRAGIVHRDLKPENLFLVERGGRDFLKVLDFGVCKFNADESATKLSTDTGSTLGTPNYMAPEQVQDAKHVDQRADIYGLGAVGYFMLTGRPPFSGVSLPALFMAICHAPIQPLVAVRASVPAPLSDIIMRALSREPGQRYDSCEVLGAALRSLDAGVVAGVPTLGARIVTLARYATQAQPRGRQKEHSVDAQRTPTVPAVRPENSVHESGGKLSPPVAPDTSQVTRPDADYVTAPAGLRRPILMRGLAWASVAAAVALALGQLLGPRVPRPPPVRTEVHAAKRPTVPATAARSQAAEELARPTIAAAGDGAQKAEEVVGQAPPRLPSSSARATSARLPSAKRLREPAPPLGVHDEGNAATTFPVGLGATEGVPESLAPSKEPEKALQDSADKAFAAGKEEPEPVAPPGAPYKLSTRGLQSVFSQEP